MAQVELDDVAEATSVVAADLFYTHIVSSGLGKRITKANLLSGYATETFVNTGLAGKSNTGHTHVQADVVNLTTDLATISGDIGNLQTDVGTLQTDVGTLQTDVGTLQSDVGTLQTDVGNIQAVVGTSGSSDLGFFGATPVTQPAAIADTTDTSDAAVQLNLLLQAMRDLGLIAT